MTRSIGIVASVAPLPFAAAATQEDRVAAGFSIEEAELGAGPGSRFPRVQASDGGLIVSWTQVGARSASTSRGRAQLRYAILDPAAPGASEPEVHTVASGDDWFVNWADLPGVVSLGAPEEGAAPRLVAHWLQRIDESSPYAYGVRWTHSDDGGERWAPADWLHQDVSPTEHGFASMVSFGGGRGAALWLDGREMAHDAPMALRSRLIEGDRLGAEVVIDARVCECCSTDAVAVDGELWAVYRDRSEAEVRDVGLVSTLEGVWTAPGSAHEDGWLMPGCPVNGPTIASRGSHLAFAWFTLGAEGKARVLVGFADAAGRREGPFVVDDRQPIGRPDLDFLEDGSVVVAWIAERENEASLQIRRVSPDGARGVEQRVCPLVGDRSDGRPALASIGMRTLLTWTDASGAAPRVRGAWLDRPERR